MVKGGRKMRIRLVFLSIIIALIALLQGRVDTAQSSGNEQYPYHGARFDQLVNDSYNTCGSGESSGFYTWMEKAYGVFLHSHKNAEGGSLEAYLDAERTELGGTGELQRKAKAEMEFAAGLHTLVKSIIPRFSLERGFEFCNVARRGERQCFLQSILIAGMLQRAGMDAGVAMVFRNARGEVSNNGHAVTLLKLPDGRDIIVDASDAEPFMKHRGLFVRSPGYRFVEPIYDKDSEKIAYYRAALNGEKIATSRVQTLDFPFIQSQFQYYRGERTAGGPLSPKPTKIGLKTAAQYLSAGVKQNSGNPLLVYMLGRVYFAQGKIKNARTYLENAYALYAKYGWIPDGAREYRDLARRAN